MTANKHFAQKVKYETELEELEEEISPVLMSDNFYGEVLFDYLEIFYKHTLTEYADTHLYMVKFKRKVDEGKVIKETFKKF